VTSASRRPGTPAAERKRRQRLREREQTLLYKTEDWRLFTDLATLPQKAGCQPEDLRKIVLKELVDNALDIAAEVSLGCADHAWLVTDDDPGIGPAAVPRLFAANRALRSSKLVYLPLRGMQAERAAIRGEPELPLHGTAERSAADAGQQRWISGLLKAAMTRLPSCSDPTKEAITRDAR
jgi:hypothetical protein